jgi:hypothetical protein
MGRRLHVVIDRNTVTIGEHTWVVMSGSDINFVHAVRHILLPDVLVNVCGVSGGTTTIVTGAVLLPASAPDLSLSWSLTALKPAPLKIMFSARHTILLYYLGHDTKGKTSELLQIREMIETQMSLKATVGAVKLYDIDSLSLPAKTLTICGQAAGLSLATRKRAGEQLEDSAAKRAKATVFDDEEDELKFRALVSSRIARYRAQALRLQDEEMSRHAQFCAEDAQIKAKIARLEEFQELQ